MRSQLAWRKAAEVARRVGTGLVLAADTVCAAEDQILNKPLDRADAERMIRLQEGRRDPGDLPEFASIGPIVTNGRRVEVSVVSFRQLSEAERQQYLDSRRWQGKSGAYGVQDRDPFVTVILGSFSNVVGLPMERLASLLEAYSSLTK